MSQLDSRLGMHSQACPAVLLTLQVAEGEGPLRLLLRIQVVPALVRDRHAEPGLQRSGEVHGCQPAAAAAAAVPSQGRRRCKNRSGIVCPDLQTATRSPPALHSGLSSCVLRLALVRHARGAVDGLRGLIGSSCDPCSSLQTLEARSLWPCRAWGFQGTSIGGCPAASTIDHIKLIIRGSAPSTEHSPAWQGTGAAQLRGGRGLAPWHPDH